MKPTDVVFTQATVKDANAESAPIALTKNVHRGVEFWMSPTDWVDPGQTMIIHVQASMDGGSTWGSLAYDAKSDEWSVRVGGDIISSRCDSPPTAKDLGENPFIGFELQLRDEEDPSLLLPIPFNCLTRCICEVKGQVTFELTGKPR